MDFELVDVPVGLLDTSMDPAVLPPGALSLAENCGCDTNGIYTKRNGYTALPAGPASIRRLLSRGSELLAIDGYQLWNYPIAPNASPGHFQGNFVASAQASEAAVVRDSSQDIVKGTRATANGVTVHAYISAAGEVIALITNAAGTTLANASIDATTIPTIIHSAAAGNLIAIFFSSPSTQLIRYTIYDTAALTFTVAATTFQSGANVFATNAPFDLCPLDGNDICIVWANNTPNIKAARWTVATQVTAAAATISVENPASWIAVAGKAGDFCACLYYSAAAGGLRAVTFNAATMAVTHAAFMVEATVSTMGKGGIVWSQAGVIQAVWGRAAIGIVKPYIRFLNIFSGGTLGAGTTIYNVDVASKPYMARSSPFAILYSPAASQRTYFTTSLGGGFAIAVAAMHAYRVAYSGTIDATHVPDVDMPTTATAFVDLPIDYKFLSLSTPRGLLQSIGADYAAAIAFLGCEVGQGTQIPNGIVVNYDGVNTVETGFLLYPTITQATPGAVGGAGMDDGTYGYIAIYQMTDHNGNVSRSTTSLIVSATTAAGAGLGKVTLVIDELTMTAIGGPFIPLGRQGSLTLFRTEKNVSQTYYQVANVTMSWGQANVTIVDQAHDSTITANAILYTSGGVLDREPPPPAVQLIMHRNRVWGFSSVDRKLLFYSGEYGPGELPWFSTVQQFRIDTGGDITAIASMDDKLIVFKSDRIFKIYGSGGNPLGQNNDLSPAALITTDTGCSDPRSIVTTAGGLMFLSPKGIMLLSRKEELQYIGQPVQGYADEYSNVVAAHMLPSQRELRFEVSGPIAPLASPLGQKLVYNYRTGAWTTHRNYTDAAAVDAIVVGGVYYWATAAGAIYQENATFLDPASTYIQTVIEFGFQAPAGKQGLIRCRYVMVNDEWRADHGLEVQVGLNYSPVYTMSKTWSRTVVNALPSEQVSMPLSQQKCEALRVRVSDFADGGTPGEGFRLRGLSIYAGVKKGSFRGRMPAAAKGA